MPSASQVVKENVISIKTSKWGVIKRDLIRNKLLYIMILPVLAYYIIFYYVPMYGAQIAFKNFSVGKGIWGSSWAGLKYFKEFMNSYYAWRIIRNTFLINILDVTFGFPAPIIFALLLNEIKRVKFKRVIQTITYMPHFISIMVISGLIIDFMSRDGLVNQVMSNFGNQPIQFMVKQEWFRTIFVGSGIWQHVGWGTIIYLAALSGIDSALYEAAMLDGAGRWKQMVHVTLPGIAPTIIILLILRLGQMMSVGSEKILLLYNPSTYETADVISTFVYRKGLLESNYSYSSAVGLFNSVINFIILLSANKISKKLTETSLW